MFSIESSTTDHQITKTTQNNHSSVSCGSLPPEILQNIFSRLGLRDLFQATLVSQSWYDNGKEVIEFGIKSSPPNRSIEKQLFHPRFQANAGLLQNFELEEWKEFALERNSILDFAIDRNDFTLIHHTFAYTFPNNHPNFLEELGILCSTKQKSLTQVFVNWLNKSKEDILQDNPQLILNFFCFLFEFLTKQNKKSEIKSLKNLYSKINLIKSSFACLTKNQLLLLKDKFNAILRTLFIIDKSGIEANHFAEFILNFDKSFISCFWGTKFFNNCFFEKHLKIWLEFGFYCINENNISLLDGLLIKTQDTSKKELKKSFLLKLMAALNSAESSMDVDTYVSFFKSIFSHAPNDLSKAKLVKKLCKIFTKYGDDFSFITQIEKILTDFKKRLLQNKLPRMAGKVDRVLEKLIPYREAHIQLLKGLKEEEDLLRWDSSDEESYLSSQQDEISIDLDEIRDELDSDLSDFEKD